MVVDVHETSVTLDVDFRILVDDLIEYGLDHPLHIRVRLADEESLEAMFGTVERPV